MDGSESRSLPSADKDTVLAWIMMGEAKSPRSRVRE